MRFAPTCRVRVLACAVAAAALLVTGCSAGSSSGSSGSSGSTGSTAPAPTTARPAPTDASGRVAQWYAGLASAFAAIQLDTEQIKVDATKRDVSALPGHCTNLRADAAKVQGAQTAPDKRIAQAVASAMSSYVSAAQNCLSGNYSATATGIDQGAAALQSANSIMNNLP